LSQTIGVQARQAVLNGPPPGSTARPIHVVVVDDDAGIRTLLCRILREYGYEATSADSAVELRQILASQMIDLILLDVMMPQVDGFEVCRDIRTHSNIPIIMVSARGLEADRVLGLNLGADDYIAKPFGSTEVLARVRAVLRRAGGSQAPADMSAPEHYVFAGWTYRVRQCELLNPMGAEVELTGAEHELLVTLLRNPQRTISRERLLEHTRNRQAHSSDRSIDVLISRLRRKMGDGSRSNPLIRTVRGVGYMLTVTVETR